MPYGFCCGGGGGVVWWPWAGAGWCGDGGKLGSKLLLEPAPSPAKSPPDRLFHGLFGLGLLAGQHIRDIKVPPAPELHVSPVELTSSGWAPW